MTAVEFYHEEMLEMERKWQMQDMNFGQWKEMAVEALRKAKEMEKEQIVTTWNTAHQAGRFEGKGIAEENWQTFESYWEENFKSE